MAADSEVIRSFLVSLGFQVDETGSRKFDGALDKTSKVAWATGKTILGVGLAAQAMVASYASSMEKLYYASRRTGASVENIQGLEFGARRIGLAAGEAQGALEAMAAAVRNNPGLRGVLDRLVGHSTAGMDQSKAMIELVDRLSKMPHYIGAQFAGMFGIDEKTFLMLKQGLPELQRGMEENARLNKQFGIDAQRSAEAAKEYANSLRDLTARLGKLTDKMSIELLPYFRQFNALANEAIDYVAGLDFSDTAAGQAAADVNELNEAFTTLFTTWKALSKTEQAQNFFDNIKNAAVGASKGIIDMVAGLAYLASGEWKKGGSLLLQGLKGQVVNSVPAVAARGAFDWINTWRDSYRDKNAPNASYSGESPAEATARRAREAQAAAEKAQERAAAVAARAAEREAAGLPPIPVQAGEPGQPGAAGAPGQPAVPLGLRNNNPGNLKFAGQAGATKAGDFAKFDGPGTGLYAMANQLALYSERGLNTVEQIVAKWAPRSENDTAAYIASVEKRLGTTPGAKLDLKDANVLSQLMDAMIQQENGRNPFDSTALLSAAQARVGDGGDTIIHQKTDIHVAAGPTAAATGNEVLRGQGRVNSDIVRNFTGSVR